jgi:hypothetical protein
MKIVRSHDPKSLAATGNLTGFERGLTVVMHVASRSWSAT